MGDGDRFLVPYLLFAKSTVWDKEPVPVSHLARNLSPSPTSVSHLFLLQNMIFCAILVAEGLLMEIGVIVALVVFLIMVSIAVIAGVIAAISAVSGFEKPDDRDE